MKGPGVIALTWHFPSRECWEFRPKNGGSSVAIRRTALHIAMDWVVLVYDVDRISLRRELDVYGATTIVRRQLRSTPLLFPLLSGLCILVFFDLLDVARAISILEAVRADVSEPGAVAAVLIACLAFRIFETV